MSRRVRTWIGGVLVVVLVAWFVRGLDGAAVVAALRSAEPAYVLAAAFLVLLSTLQRALRWGTLLSPLGRIALIPRLSATFIGWAINVLLPGRLGEVVRPALLAREARLGFASTAATVVLERFLDVVTTLLLLAVSLALPGNRFAGASTTLLDSLRAVAWIGGAGALGAALVGMYVVGRERQRRRFEAWIDAWLPRVVAVHARGVLDGFASLGNPALVARLLISSVLLWGNIALTHTMLFRAFGLPIPFLASFPVLAILLLGAAVPTPASLGGFHKAAQLALMGLFAVASGPAAAYAIVAHALAFLLPAAIGVAFALGRGVSLGAAADLGRAASPDAHEA